MGKSCRKRVTLPNPVTKSDTIGALGGEMTSLIGSVHSVT